NRSYAIFNREVSKEEYLNFLKTEGCIDTPERLAAWQKRYQEFLTRYPKRPLNISGGENSLGDGLVNCKDSLAFRVFDEEYCRYYFNGDAPKNSHDIDVSGKTEWCYEGCSPDEGYLVSFTMSSWKDREIYYCDSCHSCNNLLGCIGLHRKSHCI